MGLAISGMHYTAMGGTTLQRTARFPRPMDTQVSINQSGPGGCRHYVCHSGLRIDCLLFEQKRAEEALREAQADLAHVSRVTTMGELCASLAHEVNQPIAAASPTPMPALNWLARDTQISEGRASVR